MTGSPLAVRAEAAILRLRDVEGVSVRAEADELVEIHVVSSSNRSPKQIVRDIQAVLRTDLALAIDHRIVSVALAKPNGVAPLSAVAHVAPVAAAAPPPPAPEPVSVPFQAAVPAEPATSLRDDRILFENVNLIVHGQRSQAQVELRWKGMPRVGNASGWSTRDDSHRLVAQATTLAVQEFLADPVALHVRDVTFVDLTGRRVAIVILSLLAHRHEKVLTGCCTIESDTPQAVVLATLSALNRVVAGMKAKEPTEYVLRSETYASDPV
ncbi:MAG: hypothetical protein K8R56_08870 [Candidatus Eisenbacteria bacterium]|nr:hypothetical protein [Candidatus Eisenbacteria bacterium]